MTNAERVRAWRNKKRLNNLCIFCGGEKPAKDRIKCRNCLIRSAWHQSEYRERKRRTKNSFGELSLYPLKKKKR